MIRLTPSTPVRIAIEPVDFRRQIDGLVAHCRQDLSADPMSGTLYVFINRARTMIRILVYDGSGFWLMTKRLSKGRFGGWPTNAATLSPLAAKTLMQILQPPSTHPVPCSAGPPSGRSAYNPPANRHNNDKELSNNESPR